jgi:RND family efflux transporter MFP subunit
MNGDTRVHARWTILVAAGAGLPAAGAGGMYLAMRPASEPRAMSGSPTTTPGPAAARPPATEAPGSPLPDLAVALDPDAVKRAGIAVAPVATGGAAAGLRLPGVVEPNAYRQVVVTPLVAGRVTRVLVELGQDVREGQTMAQVFSPELSEAYTRYTTARAALGAHELELRRTEKLVKIGAASRQELERIHAEHTAKTAEVQTARAGLELLGVPRAALAGDTAPEGGASASVPAPIAGSVIERLANVGLNVDPSTRLFTVVDLSTVWVVADVYEKDFAHVRVGSPATVTTAAYPERVLKGRISYIDPQLNPATRTARVRVEVANPRHDLRLGMYADVLVARGGAQAGLVVPRSAVQNVGDRQVVYLVNPAKPGTFTEREVRLGAASGDPVEVRSGLQPGDVVVTDGSFFVRAERERLGLRPAASANTGPGAAAGAPAPAGAVAGGPGPAAAATGGPAPAGAAAGSGRAGVQSMRVEIGEQGFVPDRLTLRAGVPAQITFVRTTNNTCATEVVFPSLGVKRALPLNEPVTIEVTPARGELAFACGMDMLKGTVVVE